MKPTLRKKLFFYTSSILVISLLIAFFILERHQSRQWDEHLRAQSISFARFATPELLKIFRGDFPPETEEGRREVYDFLGFNPDLIRFSLVSPGGRVLYRSPPFPDFIDLNLSVVDEEPLSGRLQVPRTTIRSWGLGDGSRVLDLLTPAFGPTGEQVLSVRYLISYDSVDARLAEVRIEFFRIALIAVFCSLLLAALVARRVTRPISELTDGARAIARGELHTRIGTKSRDEIGSLAHAFNEMAQSLGSSRTELTSKNAELTRANAELRQIQEHLIRAERLAAIGQLAAGVSHEIDNPVGIILGYAELLLEDFEPQDPRREDLEAIIEECKRCKRITGGLLGFARPSPPQNRPLSLNPLLAATLESLQPHKLFKGVAVQFEAEGHLPDLVGDADQLRQVLVNLLINAAQAMEGCGEMTVRTFVEDDAVVVTIADTGPGVPEELRERIFQPFFSTKERGEGTGLGLSVCRKLVEEHGGRLCVGAADEGGAEFRVSLPLSSEAEEKCFDNPPADSLG